MTATSTRSVWSGHFTIGIRQNGGEVRLGSAVTAFDGNGRISEVRRARRSIPSDGQSIVGYDPEVPNVYVAATHSGVTLAPMLSEWASSEIVDEVTVDHLQPFRPSRFAQ